MIEKIICSFARRAVASGVAIPLFNTIVIIIIIIIIKHIRARRALSPPKTTLPEIVPVPSYYDLYESSLIKVYAHNIYHKHSSRLIIDDYEAQ